MQGGILPDIAEQLEAARRRLLDLTMRNHLLNYRPSRARSIGVVDELPREVYASLVLDERPMAFRPAAGPQTSRGLADDNPALLADEPGEQGAELSKEESGVLWRLPPAEAQVAGRHSDRFLQTDLESEALQRRLFKAYQQAKSVVEEQGYTILYLALGFLEWTESPSSAQTRKAPLILVPAELVRTDVRRSFRLQWTGEDIFSNISLQAKLMEQGVALPDLTMPEDRESVVRYLRSVQESIVDMSGWRVTSEIYLDLFSFTKFVMYKDLDPAAWPEDGSPADHPLIRALFDPSPEEERGPAFEEGDVDVKLTARDVYHVMDADSSQIAVLEDVKSGRNLAVEGPPGTGKSQTIANLTAELLAAGRSVLFVSEKMAALEVVKSRLDAVGLGDFCLELHSRKAKKKEVLRELERSLSSTGPKDLQADSELELLESLTGDLNEYALALREPIGAAGRSPFSLLDIREEARRHFETHGRTLPHLSIPGAEKISTADWVRAETALADLGGVLLPVRPVADHVWRGCYPGTILPTDVAEMEVLLDECLSAAAELQSAGTRALELLSDGATWLRSRLSTSRVWADDSILEARLAELLEQYREGCSGSLKFLKAGYWRLRRRVRSFYRLPRRRRDADVLADLQDTRRFLSLWRRCREQGPRQTHLPSICWHGDDVRALGVLHLAEGLSALQRQLEGGVLAEGVAASSRSRPGGDKVSPIEAAAKAEQHFSERLRALVDRIKLVPAEALGKEEGQLPFAEMQARLREWRASTHLLADWGQFMVRRVRCLQSVAAPVMAAVDRDELEPADLVHALRASITDSLLRLAFSERPALAEFVAAVHESKIKRFADLDRAFIAGNRRRLASTLYQRRPRLHGGASGGSEAGILLGEFSRKRGHMPIRQLMLSAGGLIQRIKPCFMMSPLSIAQFLDPRTVRFDVIIFDEASQVRPEDALGAFLRGNHVTVMGDTRQLPPTSFFDHIVAGDDGDSDDVQAAPVSDVESILHLCRRSFPTKILKWHYRSRHESLIAVSNQEFYDNQLLIYPSAVDKAEHLGLKLVHLPEALYDRGRSSVNRKEARAVAEAAIEHYHRYPDKSLGVGAFNIKQQQAILEEVELQLRLHPEMQEFFSSGRDEHFFVKNLETIQGDERDVIFLSIGFGFDEPPGANRRLNRNFGPLNHEGGERRLNVLVTRAREKCVVFSNFHASDLVLDANAPFGPRALKTYLEFAESGRLTSALVSANDTDSPFEDAIHDVLRSHGYEVKKQVGCAGFRVDLAIVDPEAPGSYLLGIECDGHKYHTCPVARDRDRLRQQILEGLGWRIHRVWSTDWYRNRAECERQILAAVERAKAEPPPPPVGPAYPGVERSAGSTEQPELAGEEHLSDGREMSVADYQVCNSLPLRRVGDLQRLPPPVVAEAVRSIVEVESPVHFDEVVRRIRDHCGLHRAGRRIRDAIRQGATLALTRGWIRNKGSFLWHATSDAVTVRQRNGRVPLDVDLICDEEIAEAATTVLSWQHATPFEELVVASSRLLGFKSTRQNVSERIESVLRSLLAGGTLTQQSNGMLIIAE